METRSIISSVSSMLGWGKGVKKGRIRTLNFSIFSTLFAPKDALGVAQKSTTGRDDEDEVGKNEKTENNAQSDHDAGKTKHATIASAKRPRLAFLRARPVNVASILHQQGSLNTFARAQRV